MEHYQVIFSPEAEMQVMELWRYLAEVAGEKTATSYTEGIISYCESLSLFPHRGNVRDDLMTGLRITNYRKRAIIAFEVEDGQVRIASIWHGGQDYESSLMPDETD
ncbi:type II toxin-antitoxin system RelE/ParE family toxin [Pantoea sp. FN060301]|uniref:type II toxin-antitoxin system RelE/ParE family toxin n=1 Tax=Pantoea sp. FN060301 TaxID=3420380 RepID=UPI003D17B589